MVHKKCRSFTDERKDVTQFSDIRYTIQEEKNFEIHGEGSKKYWEFEPLTGKIILSILIKMDNPTRGVNIAALYAMPEQIVFDLNTEGAYFYGHNGNKKCKLCHYNRKCTF